MTHEAEVRIWTEIVAKDHAALDDSERMLATFQAVVDGPYLHFLHGQIARERKLLAYHKQRLEDALREEATH